MLRNVASQKWRVYAWDTSTGAAKTGDAANISAYITIDDGTPAATNDAAPTEASSTNEPGYYDFDLTQAESNGAKLSLSPKSGTASIAVVACPPVVYTRPQFSSLFNIASDGDFAGNVDGTLATVTNLTNLPSIPANWLTAAGIAADAVTEIQSGLATAAALATVDSNVDAALAAVDTEIAAIISTLGTPSDLGSGATVAGNLVDIEAQTDDIGAAGAGLTAVPWNAAWNTDAQAAAAAALVAIHLDHLLAVTYDPATKPGAADALLNELIESDAGVSRYTANALEQAPSGGAGTADWTADERTAIRSILGIPAVGTTPEDPTVGILDTIRDDTNELQADWADGGRLDLILDARASQASVDAVDNFVDTEIADILSRLGTPSDLGSGATVAANLADIEGQTDDIPTVGAIADAVWDEALSGHTTADTAGSDLAAAKDNTDYPDDAVYWSSANGSAGTTIGVNGTLRNPSDTWVNAASIAAGRSTAMVRLASTYAGQEIPTPGGLVGYVAYTIDLNGGTLKISDSNLLRIADTIFKSTSGKGRLMNLLDGPVVVRNWYMENLSINGAVIDADSFGNSRAYFRDCELHGNITINVNDGTNHPTLTNCYNGLSDTPIVVDFTTTTANLIVRGFYGPGELRNMTGAGQVVEWDGWGQLTIAASCTAGTLYYTSHIDVLDPSGNPYPPTGGAVTLVPVSAPGEVSGFTTAAKAELQQEATDALTAYDGPTNAEMEARTLPAAEYATAATQATIAGYLDTEVAAILAAVDTEIAAIQSTLGTLLTTAGTESYRADGATGSVFQLLYEINQTIGERSFSGVDGTVLKIDGVTPAFTQTLDSASSPTSITRAT